MEKPKNRAGRYAQIVAIGMRHDFGWVFDRIGLGRLLGDHKPKGAGGEDDQEEHVRTLAERLREFLEELGPTFVKLGQMLSTRPDMIPRAYIEEFKKLQDHVPSFSFEEAKAIIERDFGRPLAEIYPTFEEQPVAAASIGQVHRAMLPDGTEVAVKVQRPGIEDIIRTDVAILYDMARLAEKFMGALAEMANPSLIVQEFERSILREVDFSCEACLTDEFCENLKTFDKVRVAEIYWDQTTKHVMTMEFFDGLKVGDVAELEARGHDRRGLAALLARVTMHTIFHDGLFHADPHPGNLLVLEDGALAIIDFGMVGRFDRQTMQMLRGLAFAMHNADYDALARGLLQYGVVDYDVDLRLLSRKLRTVFRTMGGGGGSMAQQSEVLIDFLMSEKLYYQPDLVFLDKTFGTLEMSIRALAPDLDMAQLFEEFGADLGKSLLSPQDLLKEIAARLLTMEDVLIDTPSSSIGYWGVSMQGNSPSMWNSTWHNRRWAR